MAPALAAPVAALMLKDLPELQGSLDRLLPWAVPHALLLCGLLWRARHRAGGRVDLLLVAALTYILWFVVIPLCNLA